MIKKPMLPKKATFATFTTKELVQMVILVGFYMSKFPIKSRIQKRPRNELLQDELFSSVVAEIFVRLLLTTFRWSSFLIMGALLQDNS